MPNVNGNEITTGAKTIGQYAIEYQDNGYGAVIPIIDGIEHPELMMGYVSETDKQAGLNALAEAIEACQGNLYKVPYYMINAARIAANGIKPQDTVEIEGRELLISYENRKAYLGTEEIATLEDLPDGLPNDAIKIILTDRARIALAERERLLYQGFITETESYDDYEDDYEEEPEETETDYEDDPNEDDGK